MGHTVSCVFLERSGYALNFPGSAERAHEAVVGTPQTQPFPAKAYAVENKRLMLFGFRKHKANRINDICILGGRNMANFELSC
jgi:hypothetical protein